MKKRWGRSWNETELEMAIADLQARGFEVIRRGRKEYEKKHFDRRHNSLDN